MRHELTGPEKSKDDLRTGASVRGDTKRAGTYQPGEAAGKQFRREGHGVLVHCKLTINQQYILAERCQKACWAALGGACGRL